TVLNKGLLSGRDWESFGRSKKGTRMAIVSIIVQHVGGAIGGAGSGKVIEDGDMGNLINAVVGAIGGLAGGSPVGMFLGDATTGGGAAVAVIGPMAGQLGGGGVGGVVLQSIIGLVKNKLLAR